MSVPFPQAALRVRDLGAALAFWCGALGLAPVPLPSAPAAKAPSPGGGPPEAGAPPAAGSSPPGVAWLQAPDGATLVLAGPGGDLSPWPGVKEMVPGGWVYLQRRDLPALAAHLAGQGLAARLEEPYPGFRRLLVPDPDGYMAVLWEALPLDDATILNLYRQGPDRLRQALAGLGPADLDRPWAPGKWTVRELVHHLVDSDLGAFFVLQAALAEPGRRLEPNVWDGDTWARGLAYRSRPVEPALALFAAARAWVLDAVAHLPGALDRYIVWPSGHRAVVREVLRHAGGHALHHILQIEAARGRAARGDSPATGSG